MKQQQRIDLTLRVTSSRLPLILQTLDGEMEFVRAVPAPFDAAPDERHHTYANGKRDKGITGKALALELLARGGEIAATAIAATFVYRGFSENSASPVLSKLVAEGKATMTRHGFYRLNAPVVP